MNSRTSQASQASHFFHRIHRSIPMSIATAHFGIASEQHGPSQRRRHRIYSFEFLVMNFELHRIRPIAFVAASHWSIATSHFRHRVVAALDHRNIAAWGEGS